jgi:hypothetical protein
MFDPENNSDPVQELEKHVERLRVSLARGDRMDFDDPQRIRALANAFGVIAAYATPPVPTGPGTSPFASAPVQTNCPRCNGKVTIQLS